MYSRFRALPDFSEYKLQQLQNSKVAVVGLGATGSAIAENLARHGVNLVVIDRDYLEENDIYSSSIYTPDMCENALPKSEAARKYLSEFTEVESHQQNLNSENISILENCDLVMDGTDNLKTRFLISEYCSREDKPWIYTAAIGESGYSMLFDEECFSCVFEKVQAGSLATCETAGIMREIAANAAASSSRKAVKYLTGKNVQENLEMIPSGRRLEISSSGCRVCEEREYEHLESAPSTSSVCGKNKYHIDLGSSISLKKISDRLDPFVENEYLLRAEIGNREITVFSSGRVIVEAEDEGHAEQLVSEKLGI
jgi:adenylyltransferase/sulfurtransferase